MDAKEEKLNEFLAKPKTQFVIPIYQRNYDWNIKQCKQLLHDIKIAGEKKESHFIGSIVYIKEKHTEIGKVKELMIIDGQQRLTSIILIYIVLYRLVGEKNIKDDIFESYLINKLSQEDNTKVKLRSAESQIKVFDLLIAAREKEYEDDSRLIENFNFFKENILEEDLNKVLKGLNYLEYVYISLDRERDDPQKIFESMNSTGLALSQSDLIRNYILMNLNLKKQKEIYKNYWEVIEKYTKDEGKNKIKTADFIRDFLTFKTKRIPNKSNVYKEFKTTYPQLKNDNLNEYLEPIKNLSQYYYKLINPEKEKDKEIREELFYIKQLEINVSYPFLMKVYEDYGNQKIPKEIFIEVLRLIQSFVFRRFIIDLPTNALNKIFMALYSNVKEDNYLYSIQATLLKKTGIQRFPEDNEFISKLKDKDIYNTQSKNKKYFLDKLENYNNKEIVKTDNLTIEHIFPQNPDRKWKEEINPEDYKLFKEEYLHTIGNLTLSGNNGALGNKSFLEKKEMNIDGKEQGDKYSKLWLNRFLKEQDKWDIDTFRKRVKIIEKRALDIWEYPNIEIEENDKNNIEINIFDIEDFTGKKINSFTFYNVPYKFKNYRKLYGTVLKELFVLESDYFFGNKIEKLLKLTKNKDQLRVAFDISNTYYIDLHGSSNELMTNLKKVLEVFEFEDELFITF